MKPTTSLPAADAATNSKGNRTPTPWYVNGSLIAPTRTGKRFAIAEIFRDNVQTAKANAAFIVRACNSHAALVKALRACQTALSLDSDMEEDFAPEIKRATAALRLAEGQD